MNKTTTTKQSEQLCKHASGLKCKKKKNNNNNSKKKKEQNKNASQFLAKL